MSDSESTTMDSVRPADLIYILDKTGPQFAKVMETPSPERLSAFMEAVAQASIQHCTNDVEGMFLSTRAGLVLDLLLNHRSELVNRGILKTTPGHKFLEIPQTFIGAVALVPCQITMDLAKNTLTYHYLMEDVVEEATQAAKPSNAARVRVPPPERNITSRGSIVEGELAASVGEMLSHLSPEESLGDAISKNFDGDAHALLSAVPCPLYTEAMSLRRSLLARLPVEAVRLLTVEPLPDSDVTLRASAAVLATMRGILAPHAAELAGAGPFSRYPALDQVPCWDWKPYRNLILSMAPGLAELCCLAGMPPAYYFVRHATDNELTAFIRTCPGAIDIPDCSGRPALIDAITGGSRPGVLSLVIKHTRLSFSTAWYRWQSPMRLALVSTNGVAADLMVKHGYEYRSDESLDRQVVRTFLTHGEVPASLRSYLAMIEGNLPLKSAFTAAFDGFAKAPAPEPTGSSRMQ